MRFSISTQGFSRATSKHNRDENQTHASTLHDAQDNYCKFGLSEMGEIRVSREKG